jgi:hypothetical protein
VRREITAWTRDHPWQADGLLAAALLGFSVPQLVAGQSSAVGHAAFTVVTVVLAATVLARRRYPVAAFAVAAVIGAAQIALGVQTGSQARVFALQPINADVVILVLLYTLAAYRPRPVSIAGLVVCLLGSAAAIARWSPAHGPHPAGALFAAAAGLGGVTLTAWVLGDSVAYATGGSTTPRWRNVPPGPRPSATRRPGSRPPPSAPASCKTGAPARLTSPPPGCAGSSATCTTGPRSGWLRWP